MDGTTGLLRRGRGGPRRGIERGSRRRVAAQPSRARRRATRAAHLGPDRRPRTCAPVGRGIAAPPGSTGSRPSRADLVDARVGDSLGGGPPSIPRRLQRDQGQLHPARLPSRRRRASSSSRGWRAKASPYDELPAPAHQQSDRLEPEDPADPPKRARARGPRLLPHRPPGRCRSGYEPWRIETIVMTEALGRPDAVVKGEDRTGCSAFGPELRSSRRRARRTSRRSGNYCRARHTRTMAIAETTSASRGPAVAEPSRATR